MVVMLESDTALLLEIDQPERRRVTVAILLQVQVQREHQVQEEMEQEPTRLQALQEVPDLQSQLLELLQIMQVAVAVAAGRL
jgi:tRNA U54 and U55 pseudouridine synthase Pus10